MLAPCAFAEPLVYVATGPSDSLVIVDALSNTVRSTIALGMPANGIGTNAAGTRVYVANSGNFLIIDTATSQVIAAVPIGTEPIGSVRIAVNAAGTRAYVTNALSDVVEVIDTVSHRVITEVPVGTGPLGIALSPDQGRLYVANAFTNDIYIIDTQSLGVVGIVPVGGQFPQPWALALNPAGTRLYVANLNLQTIPVIDTSSNALVTTITLSGQFSSVRAITISPVNPRAYLGNGAIIDTSNNSIVQEGPLDGFALAMSTDGTRLFVATGFQGQVLVMNPTSLALLDTVELGGPFALEIAYADVAPSDVIFANTVEG
jgi:YVTN family beta-propeller protein